MSNISRFVVVAVLFTLFTGCAAKTGYKDYYEANFDPREYADELKVLSEGEQPKVFTSADLEADVLEMRSRNFVVVGVSAFNGGYEELENAVAQAKRVGASVVLVNVQYTNTQTNQTTLFLPDTQTTYFSGSAYGSGGYASGTGTATTYGSQAVPIKRTQRRYDQTAVYFVERTEQPRFGFYPAPLTSALRQQLGRNTGLLIEMVYDDSPFFYANILPRDVMTKFNGRDIRNIEDISKAIATVPEDAETVDVTVIRGGEEKEITVEL